jgi:cob(I)alamin adenosyltransferase
MVRIDRVTTRGGDGGETSLGDGARVRKDSARIEAMGDVDEANAALGILRLHVDIDTDALLGRLQNDLFDLGADLCVPGEAGDRLRLTEAALLRLDAAISRANETLPPLTSFVLPGGTPAAAHAHMARTITRRAERRLVALAALEPLNPVLLRYLNRLSDLLFVIARAQNIAGDVLWVPGGAGETP